MRGAVEAVAGPIRVPSFASLACVCPRARGKVKVFSSARGGQGGKCSIRVAQRPVAEVDSGTQDAHWNESSSGVQLAAPEALPQAA